MVANSQIEFNPLIKKNDVEFTIDNCLGFICNRLVKCFMRLLDRELNSLNLTGAQFCVLAKLMEEEGLTQTLLAQKLYIESPTLVRTLDRLEELGYIERRRVPEDRRAFHIFLTEKGKNLVNSIKEIGAKVHSISIQGMTQDEVEDLKKHMYRLWENMERAIEHS